MPYKCPCCQWFWKSQDALEEHRSYVLTRGLSDEQQD